MEKVSTNGRMVESVLVTGKIISFMDMLKCIMRMPGITKVIGKMIRKVGMVFICGPMVRVIKDSGLMGSSMVKG